MSTRPPGHVSAGAVGMTGSENAGAGATAGGAPATSWHSMMSTEDRRRVCQHLLTKMKSLYSTVADAALRQWTVNFEKKAFIRATNRDEYLELIAKGLTEVENLSERQRTTESTAASLGIPGVTCAAPSASGSAPAPTSGPNGVSSNALPSQTFQAGPTNVGKQKPGAVVAPTAGASQPPGAAPSATASVASSQSKGSKKTATARKRQPTKKELAEQQKKAASEAAAAVAAPQAGAATAAPQARPSTQPTEQPRPPAASTIQGGASTVPAPVNTGAGPEVFGGAPANQNTSNVGAKLTSDQEKQKAALLMRQHISQSTPEQLMRWAHSNANNPRAAEFLKLAAQMREAQLKGTLPPPNAAAAVSANGSTRPAPVNSTPHVFSSNVAPNVAPAPAAQSTTSSGRATPTGGSSSKGGKKASSASIAAAAAAAAATTAAAAASTQKRPGSHHSPASVVSTGGRASPPPTQPASAAKQQRLSANAKRGSVKGAALTPQPTGVIPAARNPTSVGLEHAAVPSVPAPVSQQSELLSGPGGTQSSMEGMFSDLFGAPSSTAAPSMASMHIYSAANGQDSGNVSGNEEFWQYLEKMQKMYRDTLSRVYPRLTRMLERSEKREKFIRHLNDCINILNLPRTASLPERYSIRLLKQVEQFIIMVFRNFRELERRYTLMQQQAGTPQQPQLSSNQTSGAPQASGLPLAQEAAVGMRQNLPGQPSADMFPNPMSGGPSTQEQNVFSTSVTGAAGGSGGVEFAGYAPVPASMVAPIGHTTASSTSSRGSLSRVSGGVRKPRAPRGKKAAEGITGPPPASVAPVAAPAVPSVPNASRVQVAANAFKQQPSQMANGLSQTGGTVNAASQASSVASRKKASPRQRTKPPPSVQTAAAQVTNHAAPLNGPQFAQQPGQQSTQPQGQQSGLAPQGQQAAAIPPQVSALRPAAPNPGNAGGPAGPAPTVRPSQTGPGVKERLLLMDGAVKRAMEAANELPAITDDEVKRRKKDRVSSTFQSMVGLVWHSAAGRDPRNATRVAVLGLEADPESLSRVSAVTSGSLAGSDERADPSAVTTVGPNASAPGLIPEGPDVDEERATGRVPRQLLPFVLRRLRDKVEAECTAAQGRNPLLVLELWEEFGLPVVCCWLDLPQMYFPCLLVRVTRAYGSGASPVLTFEAPPLGWIGTVEHARAKFLEKVGSASKPLVVGEILDCWAREAESAVQTAHVASMAVS